MTAEQKQRIMQLRGSFLQEQAHHQAQWRLLCQCMHQVCCLPNKLIEVWQAPG